MLKSSLNRSAFSLLEILITISILSIGIISVLQTFSFSARLTGLSGDIISASFIAEDRMQELEFKESQNLIKIEPAEVKDKKDKFEWKYTLGLDAELKLYKLNFDITWQRANRKEGLNLSTYLNEKD